MGDPNNPTRHPHPQIKASLFCMLPTPPLLPPFIFLHSLLELYNLIIVNSLAPTHFNASAFLYSDKTWPFPVSYSYLNNLHLCLCKSPLPRSLGVKETTFRACWSVRESKLRFFVVVEDGSCVSRGKIRNQWITHLLLLVDSMFQCANTNVGLYYRIT